MTNQPHYQASRSDVLNFLKQHKVDFKDKTILEIGPGTGSFLKAIKKFHPKSLTCIESDKNYLSHLKPICDEIKIADAENTTLDFSKFDIIILLDTLEHFRDPLTFLQKLGKEIKQGTQLIISLPNNSHFSVSLPLLFDHLDYHPLGGLKDISHLHFFTHPSFSKWLKQAELQVKTHHRKIPGKNKILNFLTFGLFRHLFTFQNFYIITK